MIALGTSHTNGDCMTNDNKSGHVSKTAYERIADELGLELVNIGLSGCTNLDLLQATNELLYHGFLNSFLCKLFVLEPRVSTGSADLPIELIDNQHNDAETTSVGIVEGWGRNRYDDSRELSTCTRQQVSCNVRIRDPKEVVSKQLQDQLSEWKSPNNEPLAIKSAMEYFTFYARSQHELFDNVVCIDSIRSIIESNDIKFRWQVFDGQDELNSMKQTYNNVHTNLWDRFMNLYGKEIKDKVGMVWLENRTVLNPYFCECYHLSDLGHFEWYENTIPYLRETMEQNSMN